MRTSEPREGAAGATQETPETWQEGLSFPALTFSSWCQGQFDIVTPACAFGIRRPGHCNSDVLRGAGTELDSDHGIPSLILHLKHREGPRTDHSSSVGIWCLRATPQKTEEPDREADNDRSTSGMSNAASRSCRWPLRQ